RAFVDHEPHVHLVRLAPWLHLHVGHARVVVSVHLVELLDAARVLGEVSRVEVAAVRQREPRRALKVQVPSDLVVRELLVAVDLHLAQPLIRPGDLAGSLLRRAAVAAHQERDAGEHRAERRPHGVGLAINPRLSGPCSGRPSAVSLDRFSGAPPTLVRQSPSGNPGPHARAEATRLASAATWSVPSPASTSGSSSTTARASPSCGGASWRASARSWCGSIASSSSSSIAPAPPRSSSTSSTTGSRLSVIFRSRCFCGAARSPA